MSITAKHAHAKSGESQSKLATELKLKQKYGAGSTVEFALKNSGVQNATCEVISDMKWVGHTAKFSFNQFCAGIG
jgi:hypothetical protein